MLRQIAWWEEMSSDVSMGALAFSIQSATRPRVDGCTCMVMLDHRSIAAETRLQNSSSRDDNTPVLCSGTVMDRSEVFERWRDNA